MRLFQTDLIICFVFFSGIVLMAGSNVYGAKIYDPGNLKPIDSRIKVKVGQKAPDFTIPSISGKSIKLSEYLGKKNVMLSFIPAAWTPVCSDQWPGYNIAQSLFDQYNTTLIGISVDNIPTLYAWINQMGGTWFDVGSDFWPHGAVSELFGVLRSDGVSERAMILIDKNGIIRFVHVSDINVRPDLGKIAEQLKNLSD